MRHPILVSASHVYTLVRRRHIDYQVEIPRLGLFELDEYSFSFSYSILQLLVGKIFLWGIGIHKMTSAIVRRILACLLPYRLAFHIRPLTLGALDELHLFSAPTGILYVKRSAHCET